jgi:hypothetical protein
MYKSLLHRIKILSMLILLYSFCFKTVVIRKNVSDLEEKEMPSLIWESKKQFNVFNNPPLQYFTPLTKMTKR